MPYCPQCGSEITPEDKFCRECGTQLSVSTEEEKTRDKADPRDVRDTKHEPQRESLPQDKDPLNGVQDKISSGTNWTEQYSIGVWLGSIILGLLTFPIGLFIPGYFILKASSGTGIEQSGFEAWTVVLLGIFGIAAVEIGGKKGAKWLWVIAFGFLLLFILLVGAAL